MAMIKSQYPGAEYRDFVQEIQLARKEGVVSRTKNLADNMWEANSRAKEILTFNDIVESWVDGGPAEGRYGQLFAMLKDAKRWVAMDSAISQGEQWAKNDGDEMKMLFPSHWLRHYTGMYRGMTQKISAVPTLVDDATALINESLPAMKEFRASVAALLAAEGDPNMRDIVDKVLPETLKHAAVLAEQLAPLCGSLYRLARAPTAFDKQ